MGGECITVHLGVNTTLVTSIVDTGAARSLINHATWTKLCQAEGHMPILRKTDIKLQTLSGELVSVLGKTYVMIYGKPIVVYVYKNLKHDLLLGDDALQNLNASIHYASRTLVLQGIPHRFKSTGSDSIGACSIADTYRGMVPAVFAAEIGDGERIGVKMTIDTGSHPPIKQRPYRLPLTKRLLVESELDDILLLLLLPHGLRSLLLFRKRMVPLVFVLIIGD